MLGIILDSRLLNVSTKIIPDMSRGEGLSHPSMAQKINWCLPSKSFRVRGCIV